MATGKASSVENTLSPTPSDSAAVIAAPVKFTPCSKVKTHPNLQLQLAPLDARNYLRHIVFIILCSPLVFWLRWLSYLHCTLLVGLYVALPRIVRWRYPMFNRASIFDDMHIKGGALLSLFGCYSALLLQVRFYQFPPGFWHSDPLFSRTIHPSA